MANGKRPKDKGIAILLAIFFGLFTWVYTYEIDSGKFWGNLIAAILTAGVWGIVAWIWALVLAIRRPVGVYENYPNIK